jgi:hypothetical protein
MKLRLMVLPNHLGFRGPLLGWEKFTTDRDDDTAIDLQDISELSSIVLKPLSFHRQQRVSLASRPDVEAVAD